MESYRFVLFVAGMTTRVERAVDNLRHACDARLPGAYELEVVDVLEHPEVAEAEKVLATPTLIKRAPEPQRRIMGDVADAERALAALGVTATPEQDAR